MTRPTLAKTTALVLAAATLGFSAAANARHHDVPAVYEPPPVYVSPAWTPPPQVVYQAEWRHDRYDGRRHRYDDSHFCGARRWHPDIRYWPGDTVRRKGNLYLATRLSARVWNVNSPPEWTPNYWVPARCD